MIRVLYSEKGTGKTKQIINMANSASKECKGSVVFIDDDGQYMYEVKREVRFVDASRFNIDGPKMFYGFLCGLAAQDHDLEHVFIDGFKKIVHHDISTLEEFFKQINAFAKKSDITLTFSISGDRNTMPQFLNEFVI